MNYKRFFSFGCSWTHFAWPSWANIIAYDLGIPFENWGISGAGNQAIQSRLVECDLRNNFTPDDLIIVQWSSWSRDDRYIDGLWKCGGNVFNNSFYDESYLTKHWSWENDVIKNSTIMHTTNKAYGDLISYQMSMVTNPSYKNSLEIMPWKLFQRPDPNLSVEKFYSSKLKMPDYIPEYEKNSRFNHKCSDQHPDVLCHLLIVERQIYHKLGLKLKQSTKDMYTEMFNRMSNLFDPDDSWDTIVKKSYSVLSDMGIDLNEHKKYHGF